MKTVKNGMLCLLGVVMMGLAIGAAAQETPTALEGVTIIDAARVQKLMVSGVTVYDVRVAAEYAEAHIKGAKSLPYREKSAKNINFDGKQDKFDIGKLPKDKLTTIVFYCNAGDCWKSYKASKAAVDAGYKHVHWFRGGIPEWRRKKFPIE